MSATLDDRRDVAAIHPLRFWTAYEEPPGGRGERIAADWVEWVKKGDQHRSTTSEKVRRVKKDAPVWAVVKPYYEAWKSNQAAPIIGTPLDAAPFATREMAEELSRLHIRSVEDLANAEDSALAKTGIPGIRQLQAKARAYLDVQANQAGVMSELVALRERLATLEAEKADAVRAADTLAVEAGRRRRSREEVMAQPADG
jgi:hypothetical protein